MNNEIIYKEVAKECNIDKSIIKNTYTAFWKFIREHIRDIDFEKGDIREKKTNFNIPNIGKLYVVPERVESYIKRKYAKDKENQTNV